MILTMEQWIRLNAQSAGKDKIARLFQYLSRFLWYYIEKRKNLRDAVSRLKILENALSSFRKLLRLGKFVEVLYGALKTIHLTDQVLRTTTTMSRIYQSLFLFCDHLIWLSRSGIINFDKTRLTEYSSRLWLGSIFCNLIRDIYEIYLASQKKSALSLNFPCSLQEYPIFRPILKSVPQFRPLFLFIEGHQDIFWDTVKNSCDIWLPLTSLGKTKLSPGTVGLLGTISSIAGLIAVVNPLARLVPA